MTERAASRASRWPLWLRRDRCEAVAMALIGLGVVMLMQPLSVALYSYSFITILAGTLGFVIVSHFPD
jgi:CO dehydrogenase/acetyl-CoA synthase delta subunit